MTKKSASKFLSFASGWIKDNGKIGCLVSTENASLYDKTSNSSEKLNIKMILENGDGEQMEVKNFYIKETEGGTSRNGKPLPTHQVIVAIEE